MGRRVAGLPNQAARLPGVGVQQRAVGAWLGRQPGYMRGDLVEDGIGHAGLPPGSGDR